MKLFGLSKERPILRDHPKAHIHEIRRISKDQLPGMVTPMFVIVCICGMIKYENIGLQFLASGLSKSGAFHENAALFMKSGAFRESVALFIWKAPEIIKKQLIQHTSAFWIWFSVLLFVKSATLFTVSFSVVTKYRSFFRKTNKCNCYGKDAQCFILSYIFSKVSTDLVSKWSYWSNGLNWINIGPGGPELIWHFCKQI